MIRPDSMQTRFQVIPAIDVLDGKVVRLHQGDYNQRSEYPGDPVEQLKSFVADGASLIHLVDLNAARNGDRSVNRATIASVVAAAKASSVQIELGGGLRDLDALQAAIDLGVDRCIIGTAAVKNPDLVLEAVQRHGRGRIIVGVDALDGQVRVSGWEESSELSVSVFLAELESQGVQEVIFTDISRDGALAGPALSALEAVLEWSGLRVISSGGVSSIEDIRRLLEMRHPRLVGVICGKAIYEGRVNLRDAIALNPR